MQSPARGPGAQDRVRENGARARLSCHVPEHPSPVPCHPQPCPPQPLRSPRRSPSLRCHKRVFPSLQVRESSRPDAWSPRHPHGPVPSPPNPDPSTSHSSALHPRSPQPPPLPRNPSWSKITPKSIHVASGTHRRGAAGGGGGQPGSPAERCLSPARGHQPWRPAAPPPCPAPRRHLSSARREEIHLF